MSSSYREADASKSLDGPEADQARHWRRMLTQLGQHLGREFEQHFVVVSGTLPSKRKKPPAAELLPKAKLMLMQAAVALLVRNSSFASFAWARAEVPVALEQASPPEEAA